LVKSTDKGRLRSGDLFSLPRLWYIHENSRRLIIIDLIDTLPL